MATAAIHTVVPDEQPAVHDLQDALGAFQDWVDSGALFDGIADDFYDQIDRIEAQMAVKFDSLLREFGITPSTRTAFALTRMLRASSSRAEDLVVEYVLGTEE